MNIIQASRLQCALLPPGDAPITAAGAPDCWGITDDVETIIKRQKHLNHIQDNLKSDRLNNGDGRVQALRDFVSSLERASQEAK